MRFLAQPRREPQVERALLGDDDPENDDAKLFHIKDASPAVRVVRNALATGYDFERTFGSISVYRLRDPTRRPTR